MPPCFSTASAATAWSISAASTWPVSSDVIAFVPSGKPRTSEASVSSLANSSWMVPSWVPTIAPLRSSTEAMSEPSGTSSALELR